MNEPSDRTFVLTVPTVRWAIDELRSAKVHPFFLAYLHLRKHAGTDGTSVITPHWDELGDVLRVPGGPPGKPYYRPLWHGNVDDRGRYWLNRNIAGSYSPSSLREVPRRVVDLVDSEFVLKPAHARLAREHLLFDKPLSAAALAAYFYRDYGFYPPPPGSPSPFDLPVLLREDYRLTDDEFAVLFDDGISAPDMEMEWFEPFDQLAPELE